MNNQQIFKHLQQMHKNITIFLFQFDIDLYIERELYDILMYYTFRKVLYSEIYFLWCEAILDDEFGYYLYDGSTIEVENHFHTLRKHEYAIFWIKLIKIFDKCMDDMAIRYALIIERKHIDSRN